MTQSLDTTAPPATGVSIRKMAVSDLRRALELGLRDFRRKPMVGLFFSYVFMIGGWALYLFLFVTEQTWWALPVTVGFPLISPFLAVGLYEVSRRLEAGETEWERMDVLGVVWRQRFSQLPMMAWVIIVFFLFWMFIAHMLFAFFMGPAAFVDYSGNLTFLMGREGIQLLVVGTLLGAVFAGLFFCLIVVSLPMLLDREVDFVTAMLTSVAVVRHNPKVMATWALIVGGLTLLAVAPGLLGLLVVMPVLGHASWHIYRLAVEPE